MSSLSASTIRQITILCFAAVALTACGHEQVRRLPEPESSAVSESKTVKTGRRAPGEQAAIVAVRQVGVPYQYGGSTVKGFDCSGLVQYAWSGAGTKIPRTTSEQWRQLSPISDRELRVGDLLFFRIDGRISHVGLYLGDRRFVHAPSTGREVSVANLDSDFYRRTFVRGARPD
jgi:cell wall-associated NlpC family hydrolase